APRSRPPPCGWRDRAGLRSRRAASGESAPDHPPRIPRRPFSSSQKPAALRRDFNLAVIPARASLCPSMSKDPVPENAVIKTSYGDLTIAFWPEVAPKTVENFKKLARSKFYDGTAFHRIIKG